ncbi:hypothetical protein [Bacillus atrophaeus]|uniref:hypothetical protein n=1 Tax=Bacillus atrophaeus TaxID=1452 RepID=UPI00227E5BE9|nr:hypothetical protein [Bacillus atrophaeus]MCY8466422.1 hypothetical protein [Bacillus atrophaeus]MCY8478881.1 hypothetical protein [Bacillus atrophaeus]
MSYTVNFSKIKTAPNIFFLNEEAQEIKYDEFEEELKTGYRAGMVIVPVSNAIQIQVGIMTPYHRDLYQIDPGFLVEKFKDFCIQSGNKQWIPDENHEYFLGEILYE